MGIELSREITNRLLREMRCGAYARADRLPPELELARQMGISRTSVRDCLSILEREGFINRKHGVGTIINHHVLAVRTRMDLEEEFLAMVSNAGYVSRAEFCYVRKMPADMQVAERLQLAPGDMVFQTRRLISADGRPAIYCVDYISAARVLNEDYDEELLKEPIFVFLEAECGIMVYMDVTEVHAILASESLADIFESPKGSPLLYMDEVGYELLGAPVLYSQEYYAEGILHHKIIRKKI